MQIFKFSVSFLLESTLTINKKLGTTETYGAVDAFKDHPLSSPCRISSVMLSPAPFQTKAAYVLFYQRQDGESASRPAPSASLGGASDSLDDHMDTN